MKTSAFTVFLVLVMLGFIFTAPTFGGQSGYVVLTDGSKVYGTIVSLDNGSYKIKSDVLGTINIPESNIASFHFESGGSTPNPSSSTPALSRQNLDTERVTDVANQILSNERLLGLLLSLQNDPEIQSIVSNPDLKKAIDTGDINALLKSPEIQKLLNNETVKEIKKSVEVN